MNKLDIILFIFDIYLLFNKDIITIIDLQIDNSLITSTIRFMEIESRELNIAELITRSYKELATNYSLNFNDFIITLNNNNNIIIN